MRNTNDGQAMAHVQAVLSALHGVSSTQSRAGCRKRPRKRQPWARQSIGLRNVYTDPLNYLQAELLERSRGTAGEQNDAAGGGDPLLRRAVMVTIAGIAAGMRNTG